MWLADLSPWGPPEFSAPFKAVGWLERDRPFPTGPVDPAVHERLVEFRKSPWRPPWFVMGSHRCDLCQYTGEDFGKRDLYIPSDGFAFVCAETITHYMNAHGYRPPDEFCRAVLVCPPMRSMEYLKALFAAAKPFMQAVTSR